MLYPVREKPQYPSSTHQREKVWEKFEAERDRRDAIVLPHMLPDLVAELDAEKVLKKRFTGTITTKRMKEHEKIAYLKFLRTLFSV